MKPATLTLLAGIAVTSLARAGDPDSIAHIEAALKAAYPATSFRDIRPTPLPGIYEVSMGRNLAYVGSDARYFLFGHLYDMREQRDLTADRLEAARRIDFASLPLADAITIVRGDGARVLAVFSDPDCPYCRRLEQELARLDNVTVHTFLYPLAELHPEARQRAIAVWCAPDRATAWQALMVNGKAPPSAECAHPIDRNIALARKLGVEGTPALFDVRGQHLAGAAPAQRIEAFLAEGERKPSTEGMQP
ncbi:MAG: DsbC family protein [Thiobacillus sp.]|nr:DsbC family protein [Thiobacillus sp.]